MSPLDLSHRTVLVTGAAGQMGRAIARQLATTGAHLVISDGQGPDAVREALVRADTRPDALVTMLIDTADAPDARTAHDLFLASAPQQGAVLLTVCRPGIEALAAAELSRLAADLGVPFRANALVVPDGAGESQAEALGQLVGFLLCDAASAIDGRVVSPHPAPSLGPGPAGPPDDAIAVVGMGLAVPGASTPEELWALLTEGEPVFTEPGGRLDVDAIWSADPAAPDKTYSRVSGFMSGFVPHPKLRREIASGAFGSEEYTAVWLRHSLLGATENVTVRPGDRQLFAVGLTPDGSQHLEQSLITSSVRTHLTRTGHTVPDTLRAHYPLGDRPAEDVLPYRIARDAAHDLPADAEIVVVDTACSSSLYTIDLGARALRAGETDIAFCGGAFALSAQNLVLFAKLRGLSHTGRVRSLDRDADGVLFSDSAAVLALKTHARAVADGDTVHGYITGFGGSSDGRGKAIYAPNPAGQVRALQRAWSAAGIAPGDVDWIVAHSTGTPAGDRTETNALTRCAGAGKTWTVTSNKSLVGHCGWAAGAVSAIHALLALRHGVIPAQRQFRALPEDSPASIRVPTRDLPWPKARGHSRTVGVSAMGFGGTNGHLLLSDQPSFSPGPHGAPGRDDPAVVVACATHLPDEPDEARLARWQAGADPDWPASFGDDYPLPTPAEARLAPSAIAAMDRSQLMALRCADRLVGDWIHDTDLTERTGVIVGHTGPTRSARAHALRYSLDELTEKVTEPAGIPARVLGDQVRATTRPINEDVYPGLMPNIIAARVVQRLDLHGPNLTLDAGRDSTTSALATALRYLRDGELDLALVLGVNAATEPVPGRATPAEAAIGFAVTRLSTARRHGMEVLGELSLAPGTAATDGNPPGTARDHRGAEGAVAVLRALYAAGTRTAIQPAEDRHSPTLLVTPGDPAARIPAEDNPAATASGESAAPVPADSVPAGTSNLRGHLARHALVLRPVPAQKIRARRAALPPAALVLTDAPEGLADAGIPADALVVAPRTSRHDADRDAALPFAVTRVTEPEELTELLAGTGREVGGDIRVVVSGAPAAPQEVPRHLLDLHDLAFLAAQARTGRLGAGGSYAVLVHDAGREPTPAPHAGLFCGLVRSLAQELPGCLAYALVTDCGDALTGLAELAEESTARRHIPVAHRTGGIRYEYLLVPVEEPSEREPVGLPDDPVIVASGGARGLTAHLVHELVAERAPRAVWLLGTGPDPDPRDAETDVAPRPQALRDLMSRFPGETPAQLGRRYDRLVQHHERARTIAGLERACGPGRVHYRQCDVLDENAVHKVVEEITAAEGRVDIVVHGAGLARSASLPRKKLADFRAVRDVKVRGYVNLRDALAGQRPALWCNISSVSAFTGLRGEPDYGAANEYLLLASARARAVEGRDETALVSGLWVESGMAAAHTPGGAFLARQGEIGQLTDEQGRAFFRSELRGRGSHGLATTWIGEADWTTLQRTAPGFRDICRAAVEHAPEPRHTVPTRSRRAFLHGSPHREGTTAVWTFTLGLEDHPYLLDHLVDGRPTVPGTFILEMAAEAAAELAPGLVPVRFTDVKLSQFIRATRARWPRTLSVAATREDDTVRVRVTTPAAGAVPEREHTRMVVHLAVAPPTGPWCPPLPGSGSAGAPNTYELPGTPVELGGVFTSLRSPRLEPDGGSARFQPTPLQGGGPFGAFILPSTALDCLLRTSVLDGRQPGEDIPVIVPVALDSVDLYTQANDLELARQWPEGLQLRHWFGPAAQDEASALVGPDGRALLRVTGISGAVRDRFDPVNRTWRTAR
ncbi:SDR family NAD(P)-dependent oxidoreductase [Streptomyces sp. NPDC047002]|uniref:SDR family NAD(P)-dependent oxidoreductase n=1 Tax=Streptomyces sp. NPDC047002 TaxID=3155475 RepID=UPI0034548868